MGGAVTLLKNFVERGIDIDCPNGDGITPLCFAIRVDNFHLAECLIKMGANVNSVDSHGTTNTINDNYDIL